MGKRERVVEGRERGGGRDKGGKRELEWEIERNIGGREMGREKWWYRRGKGERGRGDEHNLDLTVRKIPEASSNRRFSSLQDSELIDIPHLKFPGVPSLQTKEYSAMHLLYIDGWEESQRIFRSTVHITLQLRPSGVLTLQYPYPLEAVNAKLNTL